MAGKEEKKEAQETVTLFKLALKDGDTIGFYELAILNEYNSTYLLAKARKTAQMTEDLKNGKDITGTAEQPTYEKTDAELRRLAANFIPKDLRKKFRIDDKMPPLTIPVAFYPQKVGPTDPQERTKEWVEKQALES